MAEKGDQVKKRKLKPTPAEIRECIYHTQEPLILKNILTWNMLKWSLDDWCGCFTDSKLDFRVGTKLCRKVPQWENSCETLSASLRDVLGNNEESNDIWMYFDYKHMNQYLKRFPELLESLSWAEFGLQEKNGKDSTIWIGTKGAYTPCHMDSYGSNIVAQVYGRKLWILFPPSSTSVLKPTRVPYEESSVYSNIHFSCGHNITDDVGDARVVELAPGDVLVVPKNWWHYVENLSTAISINMWLPRESDDASRLEEALVRFSIATIMKGLDTDSSCGAPSLLNPNEMDLPDETIDVRQISWCMEQVLARGVVGGEGGDAPPSAEAHSWVTPVALVPPGQLRRLLLDKCGCDPDTDNSPAMTPAKPNSVTTEDVINAFCHPSVISQVAKILLDSKRK